MSERDKDEQREREKTSLGREVFDRFDPMSAHENVLPTTKGLVVALAVIAVFFWFVYAAIAVIYGHVLDQSEPSWGLLIFTFPPIIFVATVFFLLFFYIGGRFAAWNEWGRAHPTIARWFWIIALSLLAAVYTDPLNRIHQGLSNLPRIGEANLGLIALAALVVLLFVALLYDYLITGASRTWFWLSKWHNQLVSILLGMKITIIHFGRLKVTEKYPEEKPDLPPISRGRHAFAFDVDGEHLCISCRACQRICPDRLILVESVRNPETKKRVLTGYILDNSRCSFCGLCEDVCPTGAIRHTPEFAYSSTSRDDLVIDIYGEYLENTKQLRKDREEE